MFFVKRCAIPTRRDYNGKLIDKIPEKTSTIYEPTLQDLTRRLSENGYFPQSLRQAQILILKIRRCIPAVKIFALLDLAKNFSFSDSLRGESKTRKPARGMRAEHVVKAAIIKRPKGRNPSALWANIRTLSSETGEAINRVIAAYADGTKAERGSKVRIDCAAHPYFAGAAGKLLPESPPATSKTML